MEVQDIRAGEAHGYPGCCYALVNEDIKVWRETLEGVSVDTAAAICSGGEVAFFNILPLVRKRLVLIDSSYLSMWFALGKYHLIEKLGSKEAHKLLSQDKRDQLKPIFEEANKGLPTEHKPKPEAPSWRNDYGKAPRHIFDSWWTRYGTRPTHVYQDISQADFTAFRANRHKISFVHGDLDDLKGLGPFDFVYLSNAMEYGKRDPVQYVKPDGLIAYAHNAYGDGNPSHLEQVKAGKKEGSYHQWQYKLARPKQAVAA